MIRNFVILLIGLILLASGCGDDSGGSGNTSGDYSGNINGLPANGQCNFEDYRGVGGVLYQSCAISTVNFTYSFNAELFNNTEGYADMLENPGGATIRILVQWNEPNYPPAGFALTTNPLGPGPPTTYQFTRN